MSAQPGNLIATLNGKRGQPELHDFLSRDT